MNESSRCSGVVVRGSGGSGGDQRRLPGDGAIVIIM